MCTSKNFQGNRASDEAEIIFLLIGLVGLVLLRPPTKCITDPNG